MKPTPVGALVLLFVCVAPLSAQGPPIMVRVPRGPLGIMPGVLSMANSLGGVLSQAQQVGASARAATAEIAGARRTYWATYPDKPGSAAAAEEFRKQLFGKDLFYLSQRLVGDNPLLELIKVDDGIPARAQGQFHAWVAGVRRAMFTKSDGRQRWSFSDLTPANLLAALKATEREYDAYSLERDWAEFAAARRVPAWVKTPEHYVAMLYMRDHGLSREAAERAAGAFVQVFGTGLGDAVNKVRAAKTHPEGNLDHYAMQSLNLAARLDQTPSEAHLLLRARSLVPEGTTLVESDWPLDVIVGLMTRGSPDLFAQDLAMRHLASSTRAATWLDARSAHQGLVSAHGATAVRDAAAAVQAAPRHHYGALADPAKLGVNVDQPYDALVTLLGSRSGKRPAAVAVAPAAATMPNPVYASWSWVKNNSGGWVDFWELVGGVRQRNAMIEYNRVFSVTEGEQVALSITHSMIHSGRGSSAERTSSALYPRAGASAGDPPAFLVSDAWPWNADVPGATADSGIETLSINRQPLQCHWWSLATPATNALKVAWFNESVPGGLVRSYVRGADGKASDVIAVFVAQQRPTADGSLLALLATRLGAPVGTVTKPSGAPPAPFDGKNWSPPPQLPKGTRLRVELPIALAGYTAAMPAKLAEPVVVNGAVVAPAGALVGIAFEIVPQPGKPRGVGEPLGRFRFSGFHGGEVQPCTAVEVPTPGTSDGGLHRKPVPAGTVLTFEVQ
jgi:hypothetical protein